MAEELSSAAHSGRTNLWLTSGEKIALRTQVVSLTVSSRQRNGRWGNGDPVITVYAYGYRRMQRLTYVSVWGGDGRSHQVPVYRDEYISVTGQGSIRIREDIDFEDSAISQRERLDHINTVQGSANLNIYRRHIAPKV